MLLKTIEITLDIIFPPKEIEPILRKISLGEICEKCKKFDRTNLPNMYSIFNYKDIFIKNSIVELKKNKNKYAIKLFSEILTEEILIFLEENFINVDYKIPITYIPQHKDTFYEKGFNQAKELAFAVATKYPDIFELKNYLIKVKKTKPQHEIANRNKRLKNLIGAFEINKKEKESLIDKVVILIDDVATTGATLNEGRRQLLAAGASIVVCFTIAR